MEGGTSKGLTVIKQLSITDRNHSLGPYLNCHCFHQLSRHFGFMSVTINNSAPPLCLAKTSSNQFPLENKYFLQSLWINVSLTRKEEPIKEPSQCPGDSGSFLLTSVNECRVWHSFKVEFAGEIKIETK